MLGKGHKSLQMMLHGDNLWGSRKAPTLESSRNQGRIPGRCAIRNNSQEIVCPLAGLAWEQHEQSCMIGSYKLSHDDGCCWPRRDRVFEPGAGAL